MSSTMRGLIARRPAASACLGLALLVSACGGTRKSAQKAPSETPAMGTSRVQLEPGKIVHAMRGSEDDYRKCFMRSIQSRGVIQLEFDVTTSGKVEDAQVVRSTVNSAVVNECIQDRLKRQNFGSRQQASQGNWTFVYGLSDLLDEDERDERMELAEEMEEDALRLAPESTGNIDLERLDEIVQARYPLYAHCYRDSIERRGESRGLLRLRFSVDAEGRVTDLEDAGSVLPDPFAVDCMGEAFYAIDFPPAVGGTAVIEYQLDLE